MRAAGTNLPGKPWRSVAEGLLASSGVELMLQLGPFGDRQLAGEVLAHIGRGLPLDLRAVTQEWNRFGRVRVAGSGHRKNDVRTKAGPDAADQFHRVLTRRVANDGHLVHGADREVERAQRVTEPGRSAP